MRIFTNRKNEGPFQWKCSSWGIAVFIIMYTNTRNIMAAKNRLENNYYVAAVVEYSPITLDTPRETVLENAAQYEKVIDSASQYNLDIIVFPEAGLTTVNIVAGDRNLARKYLMEVPSPEDLIKPCSNSSFDEVLQRLSCAAVKNKVYVVVNVAELANCTRDSDEQCPEDGAYFYNTNIVFDREGTIIARYRKYNLFEEKTNNAPKKADLCTFKTDFNVTFGMFICFDIMFAEPSLRLVREKQVTDVIFSAAWFSELPLLTAVSVQAGWAYSLDVNLLAADYHNVGIGSGGSGVYAGRQGSLAVYMPREMGARLLIATVPKKNVGDPPKTEKESFKVDETKPELLSLILPIDRPSDATSDTEMAYLSDPSLPSFVAQPLKCEPPSSETSKTFRNRFSYKNGSNFSCTVEVTWRNASLNDNDDYEDYKMIAYSAERSFGTVSRNFVEVCGLVLCGREEMKSSDVCVANIKGPNVEIESMKIQMRSYNVSSIAIPSTLDHLLYPLDVALFTFRSSLEKEQDVEFYSAEMNLNEPTSDLRTFAIYKLPSDAASDHKNHQ